MSADRLMETFTPFPAQQRTELIDQLIDERNACLTRQGTRTGIPCGTSYAALGPRHDACAAVSFRSC
jgi:hypothetical protein